MKSVDLNEELLATWLKLCAIVRNERITKFFTFREITICNLLINAKNEDIKFVTPSLITEKTGMLKSQTNKVLNGLLNKNCIEIKTNPKDKRQKFIVLTAYGRKKYLSEHSTILKIMNYLTSDMSEIEITKLCQNVNIISNKFNKLTKINKGDKK